MKFYAMFVALGCAIMGLLAFSAHADSDMKEVIYRVDYQKELAINGSYTSPNKSFVYVNHRVDGHTVRCVVIQSRSHHLGKPIAISCDWSDFSK